MLRDCRHWSEAVRDCEQHLRPYVIATVLGARGSTPRDSGTKMVVCADSFFGTIGGGQLEHQALAISRRMLLADTNAQSVEHFPLGEKLGQCCGGATSILFEAFIPDSDPLYLFGAGHVGRALAPLLATLPLRITWVDARVQEYPAKLPEGVTAMHPEDPRDALRMAPPGCYYLIMTHQHPLDYALLELALARRDAAYIGVIGSQSKARRFHLRLTHRGYSKADTALLHCPIGMPAVPGKRPAEIAVSVAAEIIAHYHQRRPAPAPPGQGARPGSQGWKALQDDLENAGLSAGIGAGISAGISADIGAGSGRTETGGASTQLGTTFPPSNKHSSS